MSWFTVLGKTYDNYKGLVCKDKYAMLLPISHLTNNAQITIEIDIEGNFIDAQKVDINDTVTVIAVTEDSATRSSGIAPHPLCDNLKYTAGDYSNYVKNADEKMDDYFKKYIEQLEKWCKSDFANEKAVAVFKYLSKKSLIKDLISKGVLVCSEDGNYLDDKIKINKIAQSECFIRFMVLKPGDERYISETWKDQKLFNDFIKFYKESLNTFDICYSSGERTQISLKHPAKIRNSGDKAKLISSNNEKSFVFKGRFIDANQAASIGYEATQKAHNALRWLIGRQGYRNGSEVIVPWSVKVKEKILSPFGYMIFEDEDGQNDINAGRNYAEKIKKAIAGYKQDIQPDDTMVVMAIDTADDSLNGRLSIKYYTELSGSIYYDNLQKWYTKMSWYMPKRRDIFSGEKTSVSERKYIPAGEGTPIPREIVMAAYGVKRGKFIGVDDKVQKKCIDRILPCIFEGKAFPKDLIRIAVKNVSRPLAFDGYEHNLLLCITCAMIRAGYYEKGVDIKMNLEENEIKSRSYYFGELLAIADVLEEQTFNAADDKRVTNAKRYWNVFTKRPAKTWEIIYKKLMPYFKKQGKHMKMYNIILGEIHAKLGEDKFNNAPLTEDYLLGYWCRRKDLYTSKKNNEKDNTNAEGK